MIRREDLQEAIAECEGQRNPNANTCLKLAAYHIIMDHMEGKPTYSIRSAESTGYSGDTEFTRVIAGMGMDDLVPVMDELMETLQVIQPRLYNGVMRKLRGRE